MILDEMKTRTCTSCIICMEGTVEVDSLTVVTYVRADGVQIDVVHDLFAEEIL